MPVVDKREAPVIRNITPYTKYPIYSQPKDGRASLGNGGYKKCCSSQ